MLVQTASLLLLSSIINVWVSKLWAYYTLEKNIGQCYGIDVQCVRTFATLRNKKRDAK